MKGSLKSGRSRKQKGSLAPERTLKNRREYCRKAMAKKEKVKEKPVETHKKSVIKWARTQGTRGENGAQERGVRGTRPSMREKFPLRKREGMKAKRRKEVQGVQSAKTSSEEIRASDRGSGVGPPEEKKGVKRKKGGVITLHWSYNKTRRTAEDMPEVLKKGTPKESYAAIFCGEGEVLLQLAKLDQHYGEVEKSGRP